MMPKPLLERRVLADARVEIYDCGRADIRAGRIDRRVLATLAYLAESGMRPTVTSLMCGHGYYTASGNVSHHSSGNAVDIAAINDVPILGHQDDGRRDRAGRAQADAATGHDAARPDHLAARLRRRTPSPWATTPTTSTWASRPSFGANRRLGRQAFAVLRPGQWHDLLDRLREIENPVVPTRPSRYSVPTHKHRRHGADD